MNNILQEIAAHKLIEVKELEKSLTLDKIKKQLTDDDLLDFKSAISDESNVNIIAEIKKASPSKGVMIENFHPEKLAASYREGGAAALSVLADKKYFCGSPEYIATAKNSSGLPCLFKEFILNAYQIYYARLMKADAVLLIEKLLSADKLTELLELTHKLKMSAVVEVHDAAEAKIAVDSGAEIIGVNNRNLEDFTVSMSTSEKLAKQIPDGVIKVAESGISNAKQIKQLKQAGFDAFLIGEALSKSSDPVALLKALQNV